MDIKKKEEKLFMEVYSSSQLTCTTDDHQMATQPRERNEKILFMQNLAGSRQTNPIQHLLFVILMLINIDFYIKNKSS